MRSTLFLGLLAILFVSAESANAGRPVYAVLEDKDVTIASINEKSILLKTSKGGSYRLAVGPKTWIIKDEEEGSLMDLRVGQRLHVRYIPRTSQAVTLEVLPPKKAK